MALALRYLFGEKDRLLERREELLGRHRVVGEVEVGQSELRILVDRSQEVVTGVGEPDLVGELSPLLEMLERLLVVVSGFVV